MFFYIENQSLYYPFFYQPVYTAIEDGWTAFRPETEFSKLVMQQQEDWRISYVNKDYSVCSSYPSAVVVPKGVDDDILVAAALFRVGGRFPVLSYRHEGGVSCHLFLNMLKRFLHSCFFFFF